VAADEDGNLLKVGEEFAFRGAHDFAAGSALALGHTFACHGLSGLRALPALKAIF